MTTYFVPAPVLARTRARPAADAAGPGYLVQAETPADALAAARAFRAGVQWALDLVEVVR